jgi:hypothetical protein
VSADARVASVRIRCLNPLRELQRRRYPVEAFAPARRGAYALVVYSKVYDDAARREARQLRARGTRIVLDLCDNHFYNPNDTEELRGAAARLRLMLGEVDAVVASTDEMASVLRREIRADLPITVIGDAVETAIEGVPTSSWARFRARRQLRATAGRLAANPGRTPLVWFGAHGGHAGDHGMSDLELVRPLLEALEPQYPLQLTVVSNSAAKFDRLIRPWRVPVAYVPWCADTFMDLLRLHAIALIPVRDTPFARCKTNNRLVTALAAGLAVVATGIPSYRLFDQCCVLDNWEAGLRRYLSMPELRQHDVALGQRLIARDWTVETIADQWQRYFDRWRP